MLLPSGVRSHQKRKALSASPYQQYDSYPPQWKMITLQLEKTLWHSNVTKLFSVLYVPYLLSCPRDPAAESICKMYRKRLLAFTKGCSKHNVEVLLCILSDNEALQRLRKASWRKEMHTQHKLCWYTSIMATNTSRKKVQAVYTRVT